MPSLLKFIYLSLSILLVAENHQVLANPLLRGRTDRCPTTVTKSVTTTKTTTKTETKTETKVSTTTKTKSTTVTVAKTTITQPASTVTETVTQTASCPQPTLECDKYGYLVENSAFARLDLATGQLTQIVPQLLPNGDDPNAIGYNVLDNYIYAVDRVDGRIFRVASDGSVTGLNVHPELVGVICADIDENGQYYFRTGGQADFGYIQVDLAPGSPTYGQIVSSGPITGDWIGLADWAYIPVTGHFWGVGIDNDVYKLGKFNPTTHVFTIVASFPTVPTTNGSFGAAFAVNNGDLYLNQNASGDIWVLNVLTPIIPMYVVAQGPVVTNTDGARCPNNIIAAIPQIPLI